MKTKFSKLVRVSTILTATMAIALLAVAAVSLTGCAPSNPTDAELDRIPNVPPSNRATNGAARELPKSGR